ncbi:PAS domain-containing sensor histidine kinase [Rufibacter sp. XAAS-G3-1]|uniref:PAS domain-containing sensor histidine kinase n=1 Tax=Rufibacter sp. XAAS-G3-1 TaxID=2729134 RepID=UPI0015E74E8C|nr:PAS domain-containing sensor histidine kinase [Rufibacter sp. XAAS-G3-1]
MQFIDQIFEESPNPTYIKDSQGRIIWANTAYALLNGCSLAQLLEKGALDFDFSCDRDLEVLCSDEISEIEEFYKLADGSGAWYLTVKKPIVQQNGERCLFSTSSEITNLKETIQVAEDSFAAKEKFLADVSSELEAPVNAIISLVRLLKQTFISKDQKRYLNSVLSISDYLLDVPKDVLEYARVEAGVLDSTSEVVDVVPFMGRIIQSLTSKAAEQGVNIKFTEPLVKLPLVEVNPVYLDLVLVKIIKCAIRYTKTKEVQLSVFQKEKLEDTLYLQFSIHNIGLDQNAEVLSKLFNSENTQQAHNKYKRNGIDLGVYTCKKLIDLQGGKVWLEESDGQGKSIEFILPFPIMQNLLAEQNKSPQYDKVLHSEQSDTLNLLLVDASESSQELIKRQIQHWNTSVAIAKSGEEGVKLAAHVSYDLILVDTENPGVNAFETVALIRKSGSLNQFTPIVAFTSSTNDTDIEKYREVGFTDYLRKPYHAFDLYLCISKNTGHYAREQQQIRNKEIEQEPPLFDFSGLGNMADDAVFIRKMQKLFIDIVPGQISKLSHAVHRQEWETVALIAHSLKSTYGNIKVVKAAEAMKKVEELSNTRTNLSELTKLIVIVKDTTQKVIDVFSKELETIK